MCKEWTKLLNETNILHLINYEEVKEKCNENEVGTSEVVEANGY